MGNAEYMGCAVCEDANASTCQITQIRQDNKCAPESWSRYPKCHRLFQKSDACDEMENNRLYRDDKGFYCGRNCTISNCLEVALPNRDVTDCLLARCSTCKQGYSPHLDEPECKR